MLSHHYPYKGEATLRIGGKLPYRFLCLVAQTDLLKHFAATAFWEIMELTIKIQVSLCRMSLIEQVFLEKGTYAFAYCCRCCDILSIQDDIAATGKHRPR